MWRRSCCALLVVALLAVLAGWPLVTGAQEAPPVDEAADDPSLLAFRDALLEAVRRRDIEYVVAQAEPGIRLSSEGAGGRAAFRQLLSGETAGPEAWQDLETALGLGGVFRRWDEFCTPYFSCLPPVPNCNCTAYDIVVIVAEDARAFLEPDSKSPLVAELGYDVLRVLAFYTDWAFVELPEGGNGFVRRADFRMVVDYRAHLRQRDGEWWIEAFLAGD